MASLKGTVAPPFYLSVQLVTNTYSFKGFSPSVLCISLFVFSLVNKAVN